jgi:parallel beta-helix repeat protein
MKKTLSILLLLFSICSYSSIINGSVFLDNTADHGGIIIKFNPVSPSAVYAEGTSGTNGSYNITIINGVYNISYEKTGYQSYTITNQLISADTALQNVTLNFGNSINVAGNISGNWTNNNIYFVDGNLIIPTGQTLSIEYGTKIKFNGYYSITVNGTLTANGTQNYPIVFSSNKGTTIADFWNNIEINSNQSGASTLKYCILENVKWDNNGNNIGAIHINGNALISNNAINNSQATGIRVSSSGTVSVVGNKITNCHYGILVAGTGNIAIDNNNVSNTNSIGIATNNQSTNTSVTNNIVHNCYPYGIQVTGNMNVSNNIIYNINGVGAAGIFVNGYQPKLLNNTIFSNTNGIMLYSDVSTYNPNPVINSNIIFNNSEYGIFSMGAPKPSLVTYNLFYNNTNGVGNNLPVGVGTVITNNNNGTNADAYYNIFSSPDLASTNPSDSNFCVLNSNSHAINAGDPAITNNFNATIIDIGAKESATLSINKFSNNDFAVFPNPVVNHVKIQAKNTRLFNKLILNDINGQIVKEYKLETSVNEYTLDNLNDLQSGVYILTIYNKSEKTQQIKLLKK